MIPENMKIIKYYQYGSPKVLKVEESKTPKPKDDEILLKIHASSVTTTEAYFRKGEPYVTRLFIGMTKPKINTLGEELSGEVVEIGKKITSFKVGDLVFGTAGPNFGANAEYFIVKESGAIAKKPEGISHTDSAASVDGFLTSMPFLRDAGNIKKGDDVLIYGASGSLGTAAVQIAKYYQAKVTAVCSGKNAELVKNLGADKVIDYTQEDFTKREEKYDIIFDTVGKINFGKSKKSLKERGIFLEAGINMTLLPNVLWTKLFGKKKLKIVATGLRPPAERVKDLNILRELMESKKILPVIDKTYDFDNIQEAHAYVDTGHKRGNVALKVAQ